MQTKDYNDELKKNGLKNTKQRAAILKILQESDRPITAEQVYKLALTGESSTFYEINRMVHRHYLVCLGCKKVLAIDDCPLESYEQILEEETDFIITGHKLDMFGYCADCQKKG